mgnify:CR=1 FL=1
MAFTSPRSSAGSPSVLIGFRDSGERLATLRAVRSSGMGKGLPTFVQRLSRWQEAITPAAGRSSWGVVTPPIDPCYLPDPDLVFWDTTQGPNLVFICDRHSDGPVAVVRDAGSSEPTPDERTPL